VTSGARLFGLYVYVGKSPASYSLGAHLLELFKRFDINCVLDVGAHFGEYGAFLRSIGYKGHIVSFEPVAANFEVLTSRRARDVKWSAHRIALGDRDGSAIINVTRATNMSSLLTPRDDLSKEFASSVTVERMEPVEVKRLDDVFAGATSQIADPRVYLKLDTQGYDLQVLSGAVNTIGHVRALQSEVSVRHVYNDMVGWAESVERLNQLGFEVSGMFPAHRDEHLRVTEFDCVMVRSPSK
jgi:FkbM family methyltransferase